MHTVYYKEGGIPYIDEQSEALGGVAPARRDERVECDPQLQVLLLQVEQQGVDVVFLRIYISMY